MLIRFPDGKCTDAALARGDTLLDALQRAGAPLFAPCGGKGTCGHCKVTVREDGRESTRLACQTIARNSMEVILEDQGILHVEGAEAPPPGIPAEGMGARRQDNLPLGLAVDIGTTTLVAYLTDLHTGEVLGSSGAMNPQAVFGSDVIARIEAARDPESARAMGHGVREAIGEMAQGLCAAQGLSAATIGRIVLCGNTVMQHLVCDLDPSGIGVFPFTASTLFGANRPIALPCIGGTADAYFAPCVSGYVGGDITAGLLATGIADRHTPALFIDIGTNGEMALGDASGILCCATAAGPAFEGAGITCGMAALPGAVSHGSWDGNGFRLETIGGAQPKGFCGSGLLDAMACMISAGLVDETGRISEAGEVEGIAGRFLGDAAGQRACYLDEQRTVYLTQEDVRKVQLAKGALRAGVETLLRTAGVSCDDVGSVFLAGGFGTHLNPTSALKMGMIPPALGPKVQSVGNAAGKGAVMLLDEGERSKIRSLTDTCEYLELSTNSLFNGLFIESMGFGE